MDTDEILGLVPLDEALADRQQRRGAHRRLFREMVKGELEVGPLTWLRRRALVKFAGRLEIEKFEAELLIRGVEYEGAMIPEAAMASYAMSTEENAGANLGVAATVRWGVILLLIAINYLMLRQSGVLPV